MADLDGTYRKNNNRIQALNFQGVLALILAIVAGALLVWQLAAHEGTSWSLAFTGTVFTIGVVALLWSLDNPDTVRARQTEEMLTLARQTLSYIQGGLDANSAQEVCELLLPNTAAIAVAITDRTNVLGYAGYAESDKPIGGPILTLATHGVIDTGKAQVILNSHDIGFPFEPRLIKAAIIVPLYQGRTVFGTLKFYYRSPKKISETQTSIAEGFGDLLSTQLSADALEEQTKLATSMELKALQAQINPHFLFNTINTIASFVRTDPDRARDLLREFATFYRHTLENTGDLVALSREVEQTARYFYFEVARFGEDKLCLKVEFDDDVEDVLIPAFLIQPLVENAVRHARPTTGMLTIQVRAKKHGDQLVLEVADDGIGMSEEQRNAILHPHSQTGLGIAVRNVHDRVESYFGEGSHMEVESELGCGTTVRLVMNLDSENLKDFIGLRGIALLEEQGSAAAGTRVGASLAESSTTVGGASSPASAGTAGPAEGIVKPGNLEPELVGSSIYAAAAASAEEVSAAEVRTINAMAEQSEKSGVVESFREALLVIDESMTTDIATDIDDPEEDDWDYEAEMANVVEISDEEWERTIAEYEKDAD